MSIEYHGFRVKDTLNYATSSICEYPRTTMSSQSEPKLASATIGGGNADACCGVNKNLTTKIDRFRRLLALSKRATNESGASSIFQAIFQIGDRVLTEARLGQGIFFDPLFGSNRGRNAAGEGQDSIRLSGPLKGLSLVEVDSTCCTESSRQSLTPSRRRVYYRCAFLGRHKCISFRCHAKSEIRRGC